MPNLLDREYFEISVFALKKLKGRINFDIFIKRAANKYTKLFKKGDSIAPGRLDHYWQKKNVDKLSVNKDDYRKYLSYIEKLASTYLADDDRVISPTDVEDITREVIDLTLLELFVDFEISPDVVSHATQSMNGCVELLAKEPASFIKIFKHLTKHPYLLKHSISTAFFALILAKEMGFESKSVLSKIGSGAIFHDIGMDRLSFQTENKDELSPEQWQELKQHPQIGKRLLDSIINVPPEVKTIVLEHHEQPNGNGYPNNLYNKDIGMSSKIVAIADTFSSMTSNQPHQDKMEPKAALESMQIETGRFDQDLLMRFYAIFYPKG
jgi:putative nucleotidyltransferase with HDIG domain